MHNTVKSFSFSSSDGQDIFFYKWTEKESCQGVVQIAHGMAEHAARYHKFAEKLTKAGFAVYANDHRGHGKTAGSQENYGYLAKNDRELLVEDMYSLSRLIKKEYPGAPLFLFGHSMGSFLSRSYLLKYDQELKGVILSGTAGNPGLLAVFGRCIALLIGRIRGDRYRSKLLDKLTFGNYNKGIKNPKTKYDWLCRDKDVVSEYINDDYCGGVFTASFFHELAAGLQEINKKEELKKIPDDLPILLLSGTRDPVGNYTKGVLEVYRDYLEAGIIKVEYKLYDGARHEILNELNKEDVYRDILSWLAAHLA